MLRNHVLCAFLFERYLQVSNVCFLCVQFRLQTGLPSFHLWGPQRRVKGGVWVEQTLRTLTRVKETYFLAFNLPLYFLFFYDALQGAFVLVL